MKIYEIKDEESKTSVGVLLYYEKRKAFIIELMENLDEWTAPLLFAGLVKKNIFTVPEAISRLWVRERIIPPGRQNIGSILDRHGLQEYDEIKFLEISKGKSSQDHLFIQKIDELPAYVAERERKNLAECLVTRDQCLLCFFADGTLRKVDPVDLKQEEGTEKLLVNRELLKSGKVGVGGYSVNFGESIDIPASVMYNSGTAIPLSLADFLDFTRDNTCDTTESCGMLECSRQNIAYLQEKGLTPVKENVKGSLFLKGDILRAGW